MAEPAFTLTPQHMTRNLTNGVIILREKEGSTMRTLRIPVDNGTLKWTENEETHTQHSRQDLLPAAPGRDQEMDLEFSFGFTSYMGDPDETDIPTPSDVINGQGNAADWEGSDAWGARTIDVEFRVRSPKPSLSKHERFIFRYWRKGTLDGEEGEERGELSAKGKCRARVPEVTRLDQAEWDALDW